MSTIPTEDRPPPAPPRVVAISGMIFAVLFIVGWYLFGSPSRPIRNGVEISWQRISTCG